MKIRYEADFRNLTVSKPHGELIKGKRMVDIKHPAIGRERMEVRVSEDDFETIEDDAFFDRVRAMTNRDVDESEAPELAKRIRDWGFGVWYPADGGHYCLVG